MNRILLFILGCVLSACQFNQLKIEPSNCQLVASDGFIVHPKSDLLQEYLDDFIAQGSPGTSAILFHPEKGLFIGSAGFASIENKIHLLNCHLLQSASISKMYAAIITLKLHESGILNIEDLIAKHLPDELIAKIPNGNTIKIKHLLNHSSGIPEHEESIKLTWDVFHNPGLSFYSDQDYLEYIYHKSPLFPSGEQVHYSTSGVILEGIIQELVTNKDQADLFDELILEIASLNNTHFSNTTGYPFPEGIVNTYWDIYGNGNLINSNNLLDDVISNHYLGSSKVIFSAFDLFLFFKAVFSDGLYIEESSLNLMKEIKFINNSNTDGYGMGLEIKIDSEYGPRYGHQGGSIGVANHAYWYENGGIIILLNNFAGFTDSPLLKKLTSDQIADESTLLGKLEAILLN